MRLIRPALLVVTSLVGGDLIMRYVTSLPVETTILTAPAQALLRMVSPEDVNNPDTVETVVVIGTWMISSLLMGVLLYGLARLWQNLASRA